MRGVDVGVGFAAGADVVVLCADAGAARGVMVEDTLGAGNAAGVENSFDPVGESGFDDEEVLDVVRTACLLMEDVRERDASSVGVASPEAVRERDSGSAEL